MLTVPKQKPGRSKQDYPTPPEFVLKVKELLAIRVFDCDLAADHLNRLSVSYFAAPWMEGVIDPDFVQPLGYDGLAHSWKQGYGWNWLNPEFARIEPWVRKAHEEYLHGAWTAVLVPAGVGANWWREWVHRKCQVLLLNGRLSFDEKAPFPKDCALLLYGRPIGYWVWDWKKGLGGLQ